MSHDAWSGAHRLTVHCAPLIAMQLHVSGEDAEAQLREMCSGHLPVVGQRYVWVCTGLTVADARIQVSFQLTPLDDGAQERP